MKSVIVSFICISAILFVLMIQSEITGKASCEQELEEALSLSVSQTVKEVMEQDSFGIQNKNEFIAAFLQALVLRTNADVDMTVSVLSADLERGLLDIEVKERLALEKLPLFRGREREIVVRRTVIFENS